MKIKSRLNWFIATIITIISLVGCSGNNQPKDKKSDDIVILFTNDIHCGIDEGLGLASLKTYKNELKEKYQYVVTVDAGDAIEGSALGTISKGETGVEAMNAVGYDFVIFGNHEFNYGLPRLKELVELSDATYLNSNIEYLGEGDPWINNLKPYEIVSYGNMKVGFIGITTPLTMSTISPKNFYENDKLVYQFDGGSTEAFIENIQKNINNMKEEGANYVIALGHLGDKDYADVGNYSSSYLAEHTTGIDAIIDGHSHTVMPLRIEKNLDGKDVLIPAIKDTDAPYVEEALNGFISIEQETAAYYTTAGKNRDRNLSILEMPMATERDRVHSLRLSFISKGITGLIYVTLACLLVVENSTGAGTSEGNWTLLLRFGAFTLGIILGGFLAFLNMKYERKELGEKMRVMDNYDQYLLSGEFVPVTYSDTAKKRIQACKEKMEKAKAEIVDAPIKIDDVPRLEHKEDNTILPPLPKD